ncbi:MAG TPA: ABC transporter permease [Pyrinomonadaceae bacterium]|jgi:predicted permease|nr:ABC transporter permease [Pyrinomonadaceae bacterium]
MVGSVWRDIRYGARMLMRKPGFAIVAVLTLALGIAATTATFTVVDAVLLRKLPVTDPDRVVVVHNQLPKINLPRSAVSAPHYLDYSRQTDAFESTAAFVTWNFNLSGVSIPERLQGARVTATFFPTLGINPVAGRFFKPEEDQIGNERVVVLSTALWKRLFSSDTNVFNNSIQLNADRYQVIGIAPAEIEEMYPNIDLWVPMAFTPRELSEERRESLVYTMVARLQQGTSLQRAQDIMTNVARNTGAKDPNIFNIEVRSISDEYLSDVRRPLFVLLCAVIAVLLISCANVANLLLARATVRGHEIAVRAALGAGRMRIIRQLLTESLLIAVVGGVFGIVFAVWGTKALLALAPADLPRLSVVQVDLRILVISLGASLVCGVIFGIVPALTASKTDLVSSLKESDRTDSGSRHWLRRTFVVAEAALALVLLISAGLLVRSFGKLLDVKPGFDPQNVITLRLSLPGGPQYDKAKKVAAFYDAVLERVSGLPGVQHVGAAYQTPFTPGADNSTFHIRGWHPDPGDPPPHADYAFVSADYFAAIGQPIVKGRGFQPSDMRAGNYFAPNSVAIVDEELARRFWRNGDALGGGLNWGGPDAPWATIVGIVKTAQIKDLAEPSKGTFYLPAYVPMSTLLVRTSGDPRPLAGAIRDQVIAVDPNQPVFDIKTIEERVALTLETRRFAVVLLGIFGALALLLAAIGLYGVLAFAVSQRTREIGIHMALGARTRDVLAMVLKQGMLLVLVGVVLGVAGAYAVTRTIRSLLFEVGTTDPLTFVLVSMLLAIVGFIACYLPARRATKVDPLVALRYE